MSFLSYLIFAIFLTLTYGQNFDDYFEIEDAQSSTNKAELPISATSPQPTTSTTTSPQPITSTSISPQPIRSTSTSPQPITSTSISPQPTTSTSTSPQPTTTLTSNSTLITSTKQATYPTSLQICNCDDIIKEIKEGFEKIEKRIEDMMTNTYTTTIPTTTTTTTSTTEKIDRFFDDVFEEFEESIKSTEKPGKRSKPPADLKGLLIVTLSSAGAGITVLILVSLFLCLKKESPTKSDVKSDGEEVNNGGNQENLKMHVYDELVPRMMAVPEDVCFVDEDEEITEAPETTATVETDQPISVSKIREGFIRKGVKGFK